jgi:hypothetical protein
LDIVAKYNGGSILATAAVSAPAAMIKSAAAALDGFGDIPDEDREILFEMIRVWLANDASATRSLSRPRDVAELCLAVEVHRRLL